MAQAVINVTQESREVLLQNEVSQYLRSLAAPRLEVARDTDGSILLVQTTDYDQPQSVYAHPQVQEYKPGRSCSEVSVRARWRWKATLEWDRQVITDRLIEKIGREGIQVTDGWLRMVDVESPYRPKIDPVKGTILIFTFETLVR